MTIRLLANENFPRPALLALRAAGIDIESVGECMPAASDRDVLRYASSAARWVVTFDRDYGELVFAREVPAPPAILYLRQGAYPVSWPAQAVLGALAWPDFVIGHMVVIKGRSMRRRALPTQAGE